MHMDPGSQFLFARLVRCLKLFVSTEAHEFACLSSAKNFLYAKNTQNYREYRVAYATVYLNEAPTASGTGEKGGIYFVMVGRTPRPIEQRQPGRRWVRACVRA